jgi:hypothetical protein
LEAAREEAKKCRNLLREGKDPLTERNGARLDQKIKAALVKTVEEVWHENFQLRYSEAADATIKGVQWRFKKFIRPTIGG